MINGECNAKMELQYTTNNLPCFVQWKSMQKGDYVCGLEPSNALTYGRSVIRERDELNYINPQSTKENQLVYTFYKE